MRTALIGSLFFALLGITTQTAVADVAWHWQVEPNQLQSTHFVPNQANLTSEIEAPDGTTKFRLLFSFISLEENFDFLIIRDQWGKEIERITGTHFLYRSLSLSGKRATIELITDGSVRSWGFAMRGIAYRGCQPQPFAPAPLTEAGSCGELQARLGDLAANEVHRRFASGHRFFPYRFLEATTDGGATPNAHSETNVQVAGVDEADIVKTDGERIYYLGGPGLIIYDAWPADESRVIERIDINGYARDFFLHENRLVVISSEYPDWGPWGGRWGFWGPWWSQSSTTVVTVFDVSGESARVTDSYELAGHYLSARRVNDSYRFVLERELEWPELSYYPDGVEHGTQLYEDAMDELERAAISTVMNRRLDEWLPKSFRLTAGGKTELPLSCSDFFLPDDGEMRGLTAVVTLKIGPTESSVRETSMLVGSDVLYQSAENLYLAEEDRTVCYSAEYQMPEQNTFIHKLSTVAEDGARYLASGGVSGRVLDQFGMDEYKDVLRVATHTWNWDAEMEERGETRVFTLGESLIPEEHGALLVLGESEPLAPGEMLYGTRFIGDIGFVVTFRQVDPLFTIDLSDPANPAVIGELKIPGFSTYLHELDETHLFAVGNDFDAEGVERNGVALSIFDVGNLAAPRLTNKAVVGTRHGYSEALYEHHAFTMYDEPETGRTLLAVPFTDYEPGAENFWGSFHSSLKLFEVSPGGIIARGEITANDLYSASGVTEFSWAYRPNIRRGLFIEEFVYAVSDAGLVVAPIAQPLEPVAFVSLAEGLKDEEPQ